MKTYENKEELKAEIKRAYDKYIAEFEKYGSLLYGYRERGFW